MKYFEVLFVVNDGLGDRAIADGLAAVDPRVRVHHQRNRGYGGALRAGFANAQGELISFQRRRPAVRPGRAQAAPGSARRGADRRPVDAVIGWRIKRRDPFHRIFIAKTYNLIASIVFGLRVRDIDCAMKLFRREVFDGLRLTAESPFLSAELLIKLRAREKRAHRAAGRPTTIRVRRARTPGRASRRSCGPSGISACCGWRSGSDGARRWASRPARGRRGALQLRPSARRTAARATRGAATRRRAPAMPGPWPFASVKLARDGARRSPRSSSG